MFDALRTYLSRIDGRPVEEIDRDIDDELATHLSLLESDLIESGLSPVAAHETALCRFGNPQTHKRRCRDVALKERRMKTYTQIIVTIACGLLLAAVTTAVWFNQRSTNDALASMSDRMDQLSKTLGARTATIPPSSEGVVYIKGTPVERPGVYNMPVGGATLRRMLAAAGVNDKFVGRVEVLADRFEKSNGQWSMSGDEFRKSSGKDVEVRENDLITVVEAGN